MKVFVIFKYVTYGQYEDLEKRMKIVKIVRTQQECDDILKSARLFGVEVDWEMHEVT